MRGEENESVLSHNHDKLEQFGAGADVEETMWEAIFIQAALEEYIEKEVETYGAVKLTKKGKKFIKKPVSFMVTENNDFSDDFDDSAEQGGTAVADEVLYGMLLDLRKKIAKKHNVPPYVVFQDASLESMSTLYPISEEELDEGYQYVFLYDGPNKNSNLLAESDKICVSNTEYNSIEVVFELNLSEITDIVYIRFGASGNVNDDWKTNYRVYKIIVMGE